VRAYRAELRALHGDGTAYAGDDAVVEAAAAAGAALRVVRYAATAAAVLLVYRAVRPMVLFDYALLGALLLLGSVLYHGVWAASSGWRMDVAKVVAKQVSGLTGVSVLVAVAGWASEHVPQ